jgi:hypothetical protein
VTTVLALATFVTLGLPGRLGLVLASATTLVDGADVLRNLITGTRNAAASPQHGTTL